MQPYGCPLLSLDSASVRVEADGDLPQYRCAAFHLLRTVLLAWLQAPLCKVSDILEELGVDIKSQINYKIAQGSLSVTEKFSNYFGASHLPDVPYVINVYRSFMPNSRNCSRSFFWWNKTRTQDPLLVVDASDY